VKRALRDAGRAAARRSGTWPLRRLPAWRGVLVLTYHRIAAGPDHLHDPGVWSATQDAFERQLAWLTSTAEIVGPEQLADAGSGRGRRVMLTFDDGYADNHRAALPILEAHGARATFFLITGFLDGAPSAWWDEIAWMLRAAGRADRDPAELMERCKWLADDRREAFLDELGAETGSGRRPLEAAARDWMSWDDARELRDAGMGIGAHTVGHPLLGGLPERRQREEIEGSISRIAAELGERPALFAFPHGREGAYDDTTLRTLADADVRFAFRNSGGVADPLRESPLLLSRVNVWHGMSDERFRLLVAAPWAMARR
jgi:peptidoglycan/xylan/chitin deacetylase (PgdA/CDA1 family)